MDFSGLLSFLGDLSGAFKSVLVWAKDTFAGLGSWILDHFKSVWQILKSGLSAVRKFLHSLVTFKWREIWHTLKKWFDHYRRAIVWFRRRVLGPLDAYRKLILEIYRRYWAPIIHFLDSLRVFFRIMAIFDRRLAAMLDQKLWRLEALLLSPITAALRRVNGLASYLSALVTVSGYLDRVLLLESLRRDASLVWQVLTNPRARIFDKPAPPAPARTQSQRIEDSRIFASTGGGYYGDAADRLEGVWRDLEVGG